MNASLFIASAAILGIMGCAQQAPGGGRACATVAEFPAETQLRRVGGVGDWSISATSTSMMCSEPAPDDAWGCVFSGPASVRVSSSDTGSERLYAIADGQMGAVTISRSGASCSLRSAQ